jgi:predicted permease
MQDFRHALRSLRRNPGFTAAAVIILTTGIAASTGLFTLVNALVLNPLPYDGAERLARVRVVPPSGPTRAVELTADELLQLRAATTVEFAYVKADFTATLNGASFPESVWVDYYTGDALSRLGPRPLLGRVFTEAEAPIGRAPERVAVLTYRFWQRQFGGRSDVVGRTLRLNGEPHSVLGVMPREYSVGVTDVILPQPMVGTNAAGPVIVRVKDGVSMTAAATELQQHYVRFARSRPDAFPRSFRVQLQRLVDEERGGSYVPTVMLLFAGAALLLVIGCVNVTVLLLARGKQRSQEIAIRSALGASRARLISVLLAEAMTIATLATLAAITLLRWLLPIVLTQVPMAIAQRADRMIVGWSTIGFATLLAISVTVVSGIWPAIAGSRTDIRTGRLSSGARGNTDGRVASGALIAAQVTMAVLLLAGTGAAIRTVVALYQKPIGYDPNRISIAQIYLQDGTYMEWRDRVALYERIRSELADASAVERATVSLIPTAVPPQSGGNQRVETDRTGPGDREASINWVASDYFSTLRIPIVRGRMWSRADDAGGEPVAVVNEVMARQLWPNEDPVGKNVRLPQFVESRAAWILKAPGRNGWFRIVGVVRDTPNRGLDEPIVPAAFMPYTVSLSDVAVLLVRIVGDPAAAESILRTRVQRADPNLPIIRFIRPETFLRVEDKRFVASVLLGFAALALLLAAFGLFSVASYSVAHRTREFGIRIALGAARASVLRVALRSVAIAVCAGLAVGLTLSLALQKMLARWSIRNVDDPLVLVLVVATLLIAMIAAALIPAWRAINVEPTKALRAE